MQRHSVRPQTVQSIAQQVQAPVDYDKDYRIVITVRDGEVCVSASNKIGSSDPKCFECDRFEAAIEQRTAVRLLTQED